MYDIQKIVILKVQNEKYISHPIRKVLYDGIDNVCKGIFVINKTIWFQDILNSMVK